MLYRYRKSVVYSVFSWNERSPLVKSRSNSVAGFLEVVGVTVGCVRREEWKKSSREKKGARERERERENRGNERKPRENGMRGERKREYETSCIPRHKKGRPLRRENNRVDGIPAMRCDAQNASVLGLPYLHRVISLFLLFRFALSPSNRLENPFVHFPHRLLGMVAVFKPAHILSYQREGKSSGKLPFIIFASFTSFGWNKVNKRNVCRWWRNWTLIANVD